MMLAPTAEVTPNVLAKAERLIEWGCCHPVSVDPGRSIVVMVEGDTGRYLVTVVNPEILYLADSATPPPATSCQCERHKHGAPCSHVVAAGLLLDHAADAGQEAGPMLAGLPPSARPDGSAD